MKKWPLFLSYLIPLVIGLLNQDSILRWIHDPESPLYFVFVLSIIIAILPIIPFTLFGGIMGIKYGLFLGFFINWIGSLIAALAYYTFARFLLSDFFKKKLEKDTRLRSLQTTMKNNSFGAIFLMRMLPIIPPVLIHIYCALNRISFLPYFWATAAGYIPPMLFLAFGGEKLFADFNVFIIGLILYALFITAVFSGYRLCLKYLVTTNH